MDLASMMKGMQKKMLDAKKSEEDRRLKIKVKGEAGGGIVKITMDGNYDVIDLHISNMWKEDEDDDDDDKWDVLSDLIIAAFKHAKKQVDESNSSSESDMINSMGLPFKMPF